MEYKVRIIGEADLKLLFDTLTQEQKDSFIAEEIEKGCRELGVPVGYLLFFALTEEDIPQDKRELFRILREDLCDVLLSE